MYQTINGVRVYVVNLFAMPALPVHGMTDDPEETFRLLPSGMKQGAVAEAVTSAIAEGIIGKPGKYGIHIDYNTKRWTVYGIKE